MMTTLFDQMSETKDVAGGLMGLPPVSDPVKNEQGKDTPMSQVSTAPSTPALCALLPETSFGYDSDSLGSWSRQSSLEDPEVSPAAFTSATTSRSLAAAPSLGAIEEELEEVQALLSRKIGQDVDSEDSEDDEHSDDEMQWETTGQFQIAQKAQDPFNLFKLEEKLDEVKNLYREKYGLDVDSESDVEADLIDQDGTLWTCTVGCGPLTMAVLEDKLDELKSLYREKYGQDVDSKPHNEDELIDEDGTPWVCTVGCGPLTIAVLQDKLDEVKNLYREKYGQDVDSESESECDMLDSDGTPWICTVGSGPATMGALEKKLDEVKTMYREKYGQDVDSESESDDDLVDEDGTLWTCTVGSGAATMDVLEKKLDEVKNMYKEKYGKDVDSESEIECDLLDSEGMPWIGTFGSGLVTMGVLEYKLDEVKSLYRKKYGEDVDSESDSDCDLVDEDGTPWTYKVGSGPATMDALEEKLDEVKTLYKTKYGKDVDSESECDLLDSDGTPWISTVGSGPATMHALEEKLNEVKTLYREKYGEDADSESECEGDLLDEDGTPWICKSGNGPATMDALEEKLEELKSLYRQKYGEDVDTESEIEGDLLDSDGTPWICTVGSGLPTRLAVKGKLQVRNLYREEDGQDVDSESESESDLFDSDGCVTDTMWVLEEKLDEVKNLYREKYGQDVDTESEIECDLLDADGTPWICTSGSGPATMDALEHKLEDVKNLYREKYGQDVDSESESECDLLDSDGTPWICTVGSGLVTMGALEKKLVEVKTMYSKRFGQDVDSESDSDDDLVDGDGTLWTYTVGSGPATMDALQEKLDEVKNMYKEKYGQDVESESECDLLDSDGTPWIATFGTGLATVDVLEEKLDKVKTLFREKYGQDVDASEGDLVDDDGTPWTCTAGTGLVTVALLEEKLGEVKNFYKMKYGLDIDTESDDEDAA